MRPTHALAAAVLTAGLGLAAPATAAVLDLGTLAPNSTQVLFSYSTEPGGFIVDDQYVFDLTRPARIIILAEVQDFGSVVPFFVRDGDGNLLFDCPDASPTACAPPQLLDGTIQVDVLGGVPGATSGEFTARWTVTVTPIPAAVWLFGAALAALGVGGRAVHVIRT
jgi:hypothetical protein